MAQLVARMQSVFRRIVRLKHVEFGDQFERDDFFPAGFVDQQIARDLKKEGLPALGSGYIPIGISARHTFRDDVIDVVPIGQDTAKPGSQRTLVRQDGVLEPVQP